MKTLTFTFLLGACAFAQVRINAGGPALTENNVPWEADRSYSASYITSEPVPPGASPLYGTKRYGTSFSYAVPIADGEYSVSLYLIDNTSTGTGQRQFSVTLNGAAVLTAYDLVADVGASKPAKKSFSVTAAGGTGIRIAFTTQLKSALVNAIEILPVSVTSPLKRTYCELLLAVNVSTQGVFTQPLLGCDNMMERPVRIKRVKCRDDAADIRVDVQSKNVSGQFRSLFTTLLACTPTGAYAQMIADPSSPAGEVLQFSLTNVTSGLSHQVLITVEME